MKQNPFKVGDRVRIYEEQAVHTAKICSIKDEQVFDGLGSGFHWKQCRRLVKRPRKTIWLNEYYPSDATTWSIHDSESSAKNAADREAITRIAVPYREVKVKK